MAQFFQLDGEVFKVDDERQEDFFKKYPNAQPYKQESAELGKQIDLPTMDAVVSPEEEQVSALDLLSEDFLSESPQPNVLPPMGGVGLDNNKNDLYAQNFPGSDLLEKEEEDLGDYKKHEDFDKPGNPNFEQYIRKTDEELKAEKEQIAVEQGKGEMKTIKQNGLDVEVYVENVVPIEEQLTEVADNFFNRMKTEKKERNEMIFNIDSNVKKEIINNVNNISFESFTKSDKGVFQDDYSKPYVTVQPYEKELNTAKTMLEMGGNENPTKDQIHNQARQNIATTKALEVGNANEDVKDFFEIEDELAEINKRKLALKNQSRGFANAQLSSEFKSRRDVGNLDGLTIPVIFEDKYQYNEDGSKKVFTMGDTMTYSQSGFHVGLSDEDIKKSYYNYVIQKNETSFNDTNAFRINKITNLGDQVAIGKAGINRGDATTGEVIVDALKNPIEYITGGSMKGYKEFKQDLVKNGFLSDGNVSKYIQDVRVSKYQLQKQALEQISRDTGSISLGGRMHGLENPTRNFLKAFGVYEVRGHDGATQVLDFSRDVKKELILQMNSKDLVKTGVYKNLTLKDKEELIQNARMTVFEKQRDVVLNDVEILNGSHEKKMTNLASKLSEVQAKISQTAEGDKYINDPSKAIIIEDLRKQEREILAQGKSFMNDYKAGYTKLTDGYAEVAAINGIDTATGIMKNGFKVTDETDAWNEKRSGEGFINAGRDIFNTLGQGLAENYADLTVGAPVWALSSIGDAIDGRDENIYSVYDAWFDTSMNFLDTKVLPVSKDERHGFLNQDGNINWKFRNWAKMGADMVPFTLTLMNEAKKGKLNNITRSYGNLILRNSKKGVKTPISEALKTKMIMVDSGFRMRVGEEVRYAKEQGLEGMQAQAYGTTIALATGLSQLIMPDPNFLKGTVGKVLVEGFKGNLKKAGTKAAYSAATKQFLGQFAGEVVEEEFEYVVEQVAKLSTGLATGESISHDFLSNQKQIIAGVALLSGGMGSIGARSTFNKTRQAVYDGVLDMPTSTIQYLENMKKSSKNADEKKEIDKSIQFAKSIIKAGKIAPENVTGAQIDLLIEKQKLIDKKKGLDSSFHGDINSDIKIINDKIAAETKQKLDENILFAKSAESIGLKTESVSADEFGKRTTGKVKGTTYKNAKGQEAAFLNDADGTILINKEVALDQGAVSVGSHEVLHPILNAMVGDVQQQGKIVEQFKKRIGKDAFNWVEKELTKRGVTGDKRKTEFINVYNDGIVKNQIKFNDGIMQQVGEYIADLFRAKGFRNIKFETGQDVYEFLKEFEKSRKEGKLRSNIVKAVGDVGGERGVLRQGKPQLSSSVVEKTQEELVSEVNQAYNEDTSGTKDTAAFEIAQQYQGMAEKAFERSLNSAKTEDQRKSLLENKDDIIRSMLWDKIPKQREASKHRNVFGLVKDFVKEKQKYGNVAAYINTFFARRSNEVLKAFQEKAPLTKSMSDEKIQSKAEKVLEEKSTIDKSPKARKVTSFDKLIKTFNTEGDVSFVSEDLKQEILTKLEKTIKLKVSKGNFKAEDITTEIESLIKEEIENTVKERMGKISQTKVDGQKQVVVSEEYKSFHDENFETIVKALPVTTIKKKYLKLFESKVIGREKTGPGNAIFEIKPTSKGKFGAYFTIGGYTTLLARQKSLANEISAELIKDSTTSLKTDEKFLNDIIDIASLSDIEITQTILQTELESLTNQFDRKKSENQKFDNVQFSSSVNTDQKLDLKNNLSDIINKVNETGAKPTPSVVRNILDSTLDGSVYSKKEIKNLSNSISKAITKFTKETNVEALEKVDFASFALEEIAQDAVATNLIKSLKLKIKTFTDAFNNKLVDKEGKPIDTISKQRALSIGYNMKLIEEGGVDGVIKIFKWFTGHQTSSGKIGGTRNQIYEGNPDFYNTFGKVKFNKNKSKDGVKFYTVTGKNVKIEYRIGKPGVDKKGKLIKGKSTIQKISYSQDGQVFEQIENFNEKVNKPQQKVDNESTFVEEYDKRKDQADEAWNTLIDYLTYIKENGTALDFGMTMMSLKSNMASMLKAAAPVEYYYVGPKTRLSDLRYEHIIPTEYIVLKLTEHFSGNKIDLQKLKDSYKVAIIPKSMDENINIQRKQTMGADWTTDMHETLRYYDDVTAGNTNMFAIKSLGDGKIYGEAHVKLAPRVQFSNSIIETEKEIDAKTKESKVESDLSKDFNNIIEENKGIKSQYTYSSVAAKKMGANKGKYKFFVPPSADDLVGLLYHFAGKGIKGEKQLKFFNDKLIKPFSIAMQKLDAARQSISNDYKALKNEYSDVKKLLSKKTDYSNFTYDTAIRVYLWNKAGYTIPGLSKRDINALDKIIQNDPYLKEFADNLNLIPKSEKGYTPPGDSWQSGNIPSDLDSATGKIGRKKYLKEFTENIDSVFSEQNLNKIEAVYGSNLREALEDMIYRMKNGKNRSFGENRLVNGLMNWINNSVGAIMFFNAKSAVLQTLSMTNFINLGDNNLLKAGAAFANQKQYWSDFSMIFNSDFLKQRRSGLKTDVNEAEIADAVRNSSNKAKAAIAYLLKKGFLPTQLADSFAIASGGAGFFRNRTKSLMKQGMSKAEAEAQAFKDFREITEENQQSSRPDKISQQQAGPLGRVILAFANTPAQYTRIMKKSFLDLKNGRGDWKTHVSKIMYYGVLQNFIFGAMQNALFSMAFGDDEEDEKFEARYIRVGDSMLDSILRGAGLAGAGISTLKSVVLKLYTESEKDRPKYQDATWELLNFAPPIDSKVTKIRSAFRTLDYNMDEIKSKGFNYDNPAWMASAQVISATTNIPLDRLIRKTNNLVAATNAENEAYQRFALALGWSEWDLGISSFQKSKNKKSNKSKKTKKRKKSSVLGEVTL